MNHGMAVCTYRAQIFDRVNYIFFANRSQRFEMMYMYIVTCSIPIHLSKAKSTDVTLRSVMCNTFSPCRRITLISIYSNNRCSTFG